MARALAVAVSVALVGAGLVAPSRAEADVIVHANGVRVTIPGGWHRVPAATAGDVTDPQTVLVVGTPGTRPVVTQCQIGAYHVPSKGAVVVVVGWRTATSGGGHLRPGRTPLKALNHVTTPSFECFAGRGAAAQVVLGAKAYQINVMVGKSTPDAVVAQALAIGRSFALRK